MFLRFTGAVAALMLSISLAHAAMDPYALAQDYIDQGYTQLEVKVGTSIIRVEGVKDGTKYEITYDVESGEIVKSESEPVSAGTASASRGDDDSSSLRSDDDDDDDHDSSDDSDDDHDESDDSDDDHDDDHDDHDESDDDD